MRRLPLIVLLMLTLGACGYHLRGALQLPEAMKVTLLSGVETKEPLGAEIAAAFASADARLASNREEAGAELVITGESLLKRTAAVDGQGKVSEYELDYRLTYVLNDAAGERWLEPQTIQLRRRFAFDSARPLGKSREEEMLQQEMRRDAVRMMFERLRAATITESAQ